MTETTIFKNKNYTVTLHPSRRSGWVIGEYRGTVPIGDNFIVYGDGRVAYDRPQLIPNYIKRIVRSNTRGVK
jgi:hypothetical protein